MQDSGPTKSLKFEIDILHLAFELGHLEFFVSILLVFFRDDLEELFPGVSFR
jgi:hypothetical protein